MNSMNHNLQPRRAALRAVTLNELLVVIAIIGILASMLLPALGRSKFKAKATKCTSNFKQWGIVAVTFASDNEGQLPSWPMGGTGANLHDVPLQMPTLLEPYGLNVDMWFCELSANAERVAFMNWMAVNRPGQDFSVQNLQDYFARVYGYFCIISNNWWVPRMNGANLLPRPNAQNPDGWPLYMEDISASTSPIIADRVYGDAVGNPTSGGHQLNGEFSANLAFADGHAETRKKADIRLRWGTADGANNNSYY